MKPSALLEILSKAAAPPKPGDQVVLTDVTDDLCFELLVRAEIQSAREEHGPYVSDHEALGVILEELDEFKDWVWKRRKDRDPVKMIGELVQVAATCRMALAERDYASQAEILEGLRAWLAKERQAVHSSHEGYAKILLEIDRFKAGVSRGALGSCDVAERRNALLSAAFWCAATATDVGIMKQARLEAEGHYPGKKVQ